MTKTSRRTFLKTSGALGLLAAGGGVAPAFAQPTKLHLLQWVDFIPEGDAELRRMIAEYNRQMKMDVTLETINANDLQARITAAIQSGSGADIILMLHNWPHLYANALADVSELCEWKARDQGGYYPHSEAAARAGARRGLVVGVVAALVPSLPFAQLRHVGERVRVEVGPVVEHQDDVRTAPRLDRRGDARLEIVRVDRLERDVHLHLPVVLGDHPPELGVAFGDEVDPLEEVELRGLGEGGRDSAAGGEEPEGARGLEKGPTRGLRHVPPPRSCFGRSNKRRVERISAVRASLSSRFRVSSTLRAWARGGGVWDR